MIEFIIKSSVCLVVLLGFYYLLLSNIKSFVFNRYYLLFSLFFTVILPFIHFQIGIIVPGFSGIPGISSESPGFISEQINPGKSLQFLTIRNIFISSYGIVSFILLLRFVFNIYKIIRLTRTNLKVFGKNVQLVLLEDRVLPYSFFGYIFLNRGDFENNCIEQELIMHERTHCIQYHSVDILLAELIKIILWINPMIWFFRKAIQLNHEYLADNTVLSSCHSIGYQQILLNYVFRNNSTYLASNFDYSFTKKRLMMMKKNKRSRTVFLRKIAVIPLFLILAIPLAFSQEKQVNPPKAKANSQKSAEKGKVNKTNTPLSFEDEQKAGEKDIKAAKEEKRILLQHEQKLADEQKAIQEKKQKLADEQKSMAEEQKAIGEKKQKVADEQKASAEEEKLKK
jgi:hypothetical protein